MADDRVTEAQLRELVTEATLAFFGGGMHRYFELVNHADDFTLMAPTGGETTRDSQNSDAIAGLIMGIGCVCVALLAVGTAGGVAERRSR